MENKLNFKNGLVAALAVFLFLAYWFVAFQYGWPFSLSLGEMLGVPPVGGSDPLGFPDIPSPLYLLIWCALVFPLPFFLVGMLPVKDIEQER